MGIFGFKKSKLPAPEDALPGRAVPIPVAENHLVLGTRMAPPYPPVLAKAMFGLGCFWGAERLFWQAAGVYSTAVGYAAGITPNPTYREVCSGLTGHNEVVQVIYDPKGTTYEALLKIFWEGHNPTQGMRQGNDAGTQYRSGIYTFSDPQQAAAIASRDAYQQKLDVADHEKITTEILEAPTFYFAEDHHQQYLAKNPGGYCGLNGTGVSCPVVTPATES